MMKKYALLLVALSLTMSLYAQIRGNNIVVMVQPDHADWNYKVGETARFKVSVLKSSMLLDNVRVDYEAGPVMYAREKKSVVLKRGELSQRFAAEARLLSAEGEGPRGRQNL